MPDNVDSTLVGSRSPAWSGWSSTFIWFGLLLSFSLTVLAVRMELLVEYLVAASLLLAAAAPVISGLVLAALRPDHLAQLLGWVGGPVARLGGGLLHRHLLAEDRARRFARQFGEAAAALWAGRRRLPRPWLHVMLLGRGRSFADQSEAVVRDAASV